MSPEGAITDVPGLRVGQAQNREALTGVSVVLPPPGSVAGVDKRGGAVGTRQTDPLGLMHVVQEVHAIVLSGGSAFGMDSASGVVRYLEEGSQGFDVQVARVPIVPTVILFDLGLGHSDTRPDAEMGYAACRAASSERPQEGNAGVGTGASVGKILGLEHAVKSGVGTAGVRLSEKLVVGALVAVNPLGDIVDPATGALVAGARRPGSSGAEFIDTRTVLRDRVDGAQMSFASDENTVIGVVATNARLNKGQCTKVAQMAQDGIARTVRPAHTMFDGDAVFAVATGDIDVDANIVGSFAADVVAEAILRAVRKAETAGGLPALSDLGG